MSYSFSSQFLSIGRIFIAICAGLLIAVGLQYAAAWTEPTTAPPNSNVGAPITTGPQAQTKSGTISINAWDSQYLAGYDDRANKRSIGGAYGWNNEVLYINGWNDWAGGVSIGGNAYVDGTINVEDVYIRSIGKWASELDGSNSGSSGAFAVFGGGFVHYRKEHGNLAKGSAPLCSSWGAGRCEYPDPRRQPTVFSRSKTSVLFFTPKINFFIEG